MPRIRWTEYNHEEVKAFVNKHGGKVDFGLHVITQDDGQKVALIPWDYVTAFSSDEWRSFMEAPE